MKVIIVGGGISGLLLATQLSSFYEEVIIFESKTNKLGTPQNKHLHVLLKKGQDIFFDFFPEYLSVFRKDCPVIDWAKDTKWESIAGRFPRYNSKIETFSFSRNYFEKILYSIIQEKKNIQLIEEKVTNLIFEKMNIIGVSTKTKEFHATRVFICGGAHFPLKKLLEGKYIFHERVKKINITYRSSIYSMDNFQHKDCKQYYSQLILPHTKEGLVQMPIEDEQYINTEIFYKINRKKIHNTFNFEFTKKIVFRRKMPKMNGLIILGDSLCSLNPVYGQGMTVAFMQVKKICDNINLQDYKLQKKISQLNLIPWLLSNLSFQKKVNFLNLYLLTFYEKCISSRTVHQNFLNILHLEGDYYNLFDLSVLCKALIKNFYDRKIK